MSTVYLNGSYLPMSEARISPMDRGFLFGDGIYEFIPSYAGRMVGFRPHIERMQNGLGAIDLILDYSEAQWCEVCENLIQKNGSSNLGIYLQVSRGADNKRFHAFPDDIEPTVFGFTFEIPEPVKSDKNTAKGYKASTAQDMRWKRRHIKSTALLGNVMHYQNAYAAGRDETLLFNENNELTEGSTTNAYIVKEGTVITPPLDGQCLPGITRQILLAILRQDGSIPVKERAVTKSEVLAADEVWFTASSKEIAAIVEIDGRPVGDGKVGTVWEKAMALYAAHKFDY